MRCGSVAQAWDTAVIEGEGEQFQVGYISYTIGVGQEQMEIVETV